MFVEVINSRIHKVLPLQTKWPSGLDFTLLMAQKIESIHEMPRYHGWKTWTY
jgi:hypothetical protein